MEKVQFELHRRAIRFLITHQSGSTQKAILEAVMNSIDAGATRIDVNVNFNAISIVDNGKGFASKEEIQKWFAVFCAPHVKGDAKYARFRMGRGQLFNLGPNIWRTGPFKMVVDFTINDLDDYTFSLSDKEPISPGMRVDIKLKERLNSTMLMTIADELRDYVEWGEAAVYFNGDLISKDRSKVKWDLETPDMFFKLSTSTYRGLKVYNQGVLLCVIPKDKFGISGAIVSKEALDCNFARNEVLASCRVFKRIEKAIKEYAGIEINTKNKMLDAQERVFMMRSLADGTASWDSCENTKLLRDASGKSYSAKNLGRISRWTGWSVIGNKVPYSFAQEGNQTADNLIQTKHALIFSDEMLAAFNVKNPAAFLTKIHAPFADHFIYVPFENLSKDVNASFRVLTENEITAKEQCILDALREVAQRHAQLVYDAQNPGGAFHYEQPRQIRLGESDVADGWTDGVSYIVFNRAFVEKVGTSETGFSRLMLLMLHEQCHGEDDRNTHVHSYEFYQLFETLADEASAIASRAYSSYINKINNELKRITKRQARAALQEKSRIEGEAALAAA